MATLLCDALRRADELSARHGGAAGAGPLAGAARQHNGSGFRRERQERRCPAKRGMSFCRWTVSPAARSTRCPSCSMAPKKTHTMKVLRGGEVVSLPAVTVSPTLDENGRVQYATDFRVAAQSLSVHSTLAMGGTVPLLQRCDSGRLLAAVYRQGGHGGLSGPIGTVSAVRQAVRYGWRDDAFPDGSADDQCGHLQPAALFPHWTAASCSFLRGRG